MFHAPDRRAKAAGLTAAVILAAGSSYAQDPARISNEELLDVPVTSQRIAGAESKQKIEPPTNMDDPEQIRLGMQYFNQFNCSGCHAANGAGGMGPSLSNRKFIYGGDPANIFLTIQQGRPNGMPAWGHMLTHDVIWRIVAYVKSISNAPQDGWGKTTSLETFQIEQVPAQRLNTATPWEHTQAFSFGQPPFKNIEKPPNENGAE